MSFKPSFAAVLALLPLAQAEAYEVKQTDHFGTLSLKIADEFHLAAMCTVSGGSSAERVDQLAKLVDVIPSLGDYLAEAMRTAPLQKGEALCGLRHYRGPKPLTLPAQTEGFTLDIRTYEKGNLLGGGAPRFACNKVPVNLLGACFEEITLKDSDGNIADGVTGCIEVTMPDDAELLSIVLYAGQVSTVISEQTGAEATAVQAKPCSDRSY